MSRALVITYHAVEPGEGPLVVDPLRFAAQLDAIVESGARAVTVSVLADALRAGALTEPTVALTFDDGIASVARIAAPLLAERRLPATVFCVAGHLGAVSDWPSALPRARPFRLAEPKELSALAQQGLEIGCHGLTHAPLDSSSKHLLIRELVGAKELLEQTVDAPITALAYPYGAMPSAPGRALVEAEYGSAWTTCAGYVEPGADLFAAPRVDACYLQRPALLRAALSGSLRAYLCARRLGSRARRAFVPDYRAAGRS